MLYYYCHDHVLYFYVLQLLLFIRNHSQSCVTDMYWDTESPNGVRDTAIYYPAIYRLETPLFRIVIIRFNWLF